MTTLPTIYLTKKKETLAEKRAKLSKPLQILTSLKTTAVLGATLATLLAPAAAGRLALGAVKGVGRFVAKRPLASVLGAGALISSAKLRKDVVALPGKTLGAGKKLGEIYEDPSKAADILGIKEKMTKKEKLIAGAKVAGVGGALIAGGIIAKKGIEKYKESKTAIPDIAGLKSLGFTDPRPVGLGGVPVSVAGVPQITPSGAPQSMNGARPIHNIIQIAIK